MSALRPSGAGADPDRVLFESPVVRIGAFRCPVEHPRFSNTRPLDEYLFVFPRVACWIEQQGHRPFIADPTTIPLYNPRQPYQRAPIDPSGDNTDWFAINPELLREAVGRFDRRIADSDRLFIRSAVNAEAATFMAQRRVFDHVSMAAEPDAMLVEESVLAILGNVVELSMAPDRRGDGPNANTALADAARVHLARSFLRKEGVADVAAALGVSPFHLCRVFRRETGHSLHQFRKELRLRWSLQPLADGVDILTVALAAGFAHHSHFTTAFRRTFGVQPSQFRAGRS